MMRIASVDMPYAHWVDVLRHRADTEPERLAFGFMLDGTDGETQFTYAQLDLAARKIAAALQQAGCEGERAVLLYAPSAEYVCALMGCLYAGVTAVPAYVPRKSTAHAHLKRVIADSRATSLLATSHTVAALKDQPEWFAQRQAGLSMLETDALSPALAAQWTLPRLDGETLAILQYTSGSTGAPKGVQLRHRHLLANSRIISRAMGSNRESVGVVWLPPYHDMGLIGGLLQPMYAGFPVHLMSPSTFLQRPIRWLEAISKHRGTISAAPNFAYELCARRVRPDQLKSLDLSSWQVAGSGAEPVRANILREFADVFAVAGFDKRAFFPCYGMAEATLYVAGGPRMAEIRTVNAARDALAAGSIRLSGEGSGCELTSSGRVDPEVDVCIVDPISLGVCNPGDIGEIWISGASIADGYWDQPAATAATFRAQIAGSNGRWLRSGDLGCLVDGELYVTGRIKDLIIIRGQNHYPQDIEATLDGIHPALRMHGAAAFAVETADGEQLGLVLEVERLADADLAQVAAAVRGAISERHQLQIGHLAFVRAGSVPKTSSGKVKRYLARQLLLQGALPVLATSGELCPCP